MKLILKVAIITFFLITSFDSQVIGKSTFIGNFPGNNFSEENKLIATNDTFRFVSGCGNISFGGDVMINDSVPEGMTARIQYATCSKEQSVSFGQNGNFVYQTEIGFNGLISFSYHICDVNDEENYADAKVYIYMKSDFDCDGVFDEQDMDDDNDGIPDAVEGNGEVDTDNDGIPDIFDIDDDNDGIPDVREWQPETSYLVPSGVDSNHNGWDDVYEKKLGNNKFQAVDTDEDGIPDFRDDDSDNDEITDFVEATDSNFDSLADMSFANSDNDYDGLDDAFDIVRFWHQECNSTGSNVPLPDHNKNGIPDFREKIAVKEPKLLAYEISMITFQNPTNGLFSIQIPKYSVNLKTYIRVFNMNGELLENIRVTSSVTNINMTSYNPGIYIIKITSPESSCTKRLILQKG